MACTGIRECCSRFYTNYVEGHERNLLMLAVTIFALTLLAGIAIHWIAYSMDCLVPMNVYFPTMLSFLGINAMLVILLNRTMKRSGTV